jgi:hypothetical protein
MKILATAFKLLTGFILALVIITGCESTDSEGSQSSQISGGVYYGTGFYDPWYYGAGYYPPNVIVTPPPDRPVDPPHVEHPIANPPSVSAPRPMPTIPAAPRPAFRR